MRISIHTVVKDALRLDFHLLEMIRHHLDFADELVLMEGYSTDGTYEAVKKISDKVKVIRRNWSPVESYCDYVNLALEYCTGDWCIKLDADEFIPEWEWDRLRAFLSKTSDLIVPIRLRNFYGNYKVEHVNPRRMAWPEFKWCIHPNRKEIRFWGDGSNASVANESLEYGRSAETFEVHHFGAVRHPARLREKWRTQAIRNQRHTGKYQDRRRIWPLPRWVFDLFPYRWMNPGLIDDLKIYPGPYLRIIEQNPEEFVRDKFVTFNHLVAH